MALANIRGPRTNKSGFLSFLRPRTKKTGFRRSPSCLHFLKQKHLDHPESQVRHKVCSHPPKYTYICIVCYMPGALLELNIHWGAQDLVLGSDELAASAPKLLPAKIRLWGGADSNKTAVNAFSRQCSF